MDGVWRRVQKIAALNLERYPKNGTGYSQALLTLRLGAAKASEGLLCGRRLVADRAWLRILNQLTEPRLTRLSSDAG